MPKKKRRDTPAKQSRRFVETARQLETDESGKEFEWAFKKVVSRKTKTKQRKALSSS